MPRSIDEEKVTAVVVAFKELGTGYRVAKKLGIPPSSVHSHLDQAVRMGLLKPGEELKKPPVEDPPEGMKVAGTSTLYDDKGDIRLTWVKLKEDRAQLEEKIRAVADELKVGIPRRKPTKGPPHVEKDLMSLIPFGDPHFGLYVWGEETRTEDFDLEVARRDLCAAVEYLVDQGPPSETCVIANLGDFFHADNLEGKTARSGHILDMDTRLPKVIRVGVAAIRTAIETALRKHRTVEVVNSAGNHDEVLSMALSILLSHVYEKEPRVVIHDTPTRRHYIRHGKVLIGVTHGDLVKEDKLPLLMATECAEDWGKTTFRYFIKGHIHHKRAVEFNGCVVETFRTLAPGDSYSSGIGYHAGRDMNNITLHREFGEVSRITASINLLRELMGEEGGSGGGK